MSRPLRIEYGGALYHITSRGNERKNIFLDDTDRVKFLDITADYHERYGILIHSFVIMDNHYHLILETPQGNLLKVMHGINGSYTGYFNRKYNRSGHLFQGRYKGILVDKDEYLVPLSRYVHLNPVKAGIVEKPEQYRWSSYAGYIGKGRSYDWVEYSWIQGKFGSEVKAAEKSYKKYVDAGISQDQSDLFDTLEGQVLLGGETFLAKIRKLLSGKKLSNEIIARKRIKALMRHEDIISTVAQAFKTDVETIVRRGTRSNVARNVTIYILQRYSGMSNEEIGRIFGGMHSSTVSKAAARFREGMARDRKLGKKVESVMSIVKA